MTKVYIGDLDPGALVEHLWKAQQAGRRDVLLQTPFFLEPRFDREHLDLVLSQGAGWLHTYSGRYVCCDPNEEWADGFAYDCATDCPGLFEQVVTGMRRSASSV